METPAAYIPIDRRHAMIRGQSLPDRMQGAALFADISGFTPLTEALVRELGPQRGPEELTYYLNIVYDAMIAELHNYQGSVIGFSGDAITCWLNGDNGLRATACALAMQKAMKSFARLTTRTGTTLSLEMKAAVAAGSARRFLVGGPEVQVIDVLAGEMLDRLAVAEHLAQKGEVILDPNTTMALKPHLRVRDWRCDEQTGEYYGIASGLRVNIKPSPWPPMAADSMSDEQIRPWLLESVYERMQSGQGEFLAELRPVAALFLRFEGIDYDEDPEAVQKLDALIRQVQAIFVRYEATLIQLTIGDKGSYLWAAFGAPVAHENDAERAISAALDLRALIPSLDYVHQFRIGISHGRIRAGAYGSTTRRTYGCQGDDINLAARLMQVAMPGEILVSSWARKEAADAFDWERLPDIRVKGKSEPVPLFRLIGPKERHLVRLQALEYALPMVGRQVELALITQKMDQALSGQGQIIGITGEAGMGKSRLLAEVIRLANENKFQGYGGECQSYGTNSSYMVWRSIWRSFFGLEPGWTLDEQVSRLETQLGRISPELIPRLPLLGLVLNLNIPDNDLTRSLDAKLRKTSLESLLADCLQAWTSETPTLIVLEDAHWMDPLSNDLLEVLGRSIHNLPVLMILAYRSVGLQQALAPQVAELPYFTEIMLSEFAREEAQELIQLKLQKMFNQTLIQMNLELVERITLRAEGNPFYVEELLNYLWDRRVDPQDEQALEALDLPTSLQSLILSRIDQLTESQKITLKVASVIGRVFRAAVIFGAYPHLGDAQQIRSDLDVLSRIELTILEDEAELTYFFKHIVTQEVAYESLPYATRAVLHDQVGQYHERISQDTLDQFLDLLAFHFGRSENIPKKREYFLKAGESAQARYANAAAIDYYQRLLPLLGDDDRIPVLLKLGKVLELVGEWEKAEEVYNEALVLSTHLGDRLAEARGQTALGELSRKQGLYDEARDWLQRAQDLFEDLGNEEGVGQTSHYSGTLAAQQGDYELARSLFEKSLVIRRKLDDKPQIANLLNNLGILARYRGDYDQAWELSEESLRIRRELGDRWHLANSLNNQAIVAMDRGDYADARARLEEAVTITRQIGDRWYTANAINNLGNVARAQGNFQEARFLYKDSLRINRDLGDGWAIAYLLEDMGGLASLEGQYLKALQLIGAASMIRQEIGSPLPPAAAEKLNQLLEPAYQDLSDNEQFKALAEGRSMSLEEAINYAFQDVV